MGLYSPAPPARPFNEDKSILLTSWWITIMCATFILFRLVGRFIRVGSLFGEDKVAALALIPLFVRMAFVHPILLYGTNNVLLGDALPLSESDINNRSAASRLVLVARILHPTILWLLKVVTLEFFDRLAGTSGKNRYTLLLRITRASLAATFVAILIADFAECQPTSHYWQVVPDPGGRCRQGYAHLLTVTVGNVFTDLLLVVFPVPIIARSRLSGWRKALLGMLFCLHLFTVVVALYRVPDIVREGGYQGTRTMWASAEILVACLTANALTLGTFVRDTGVKKKKFQPYLAGSEEVRSTRRDSRGMGIGKKVSWGDRESDGGTEGRRELGGVEGLEDNGVKSTAAVGEHREGVKRTESLDSLIPRSRFTTSSPDGAVVKTTTIEVTVSQAKQGGYHGSGGMTELLPRLAEGLVTASGRGKARGTSVPLKELSSLPDPAADQGGSGGKYSV